MTLNMIYIIQFYRNKGELKNKLKNKNRNKKNKKGNLKKIE